MTAPLLAHDDFGRGAPVVLLHGFPFDRALWAPQRYALAGRARVIAPDLRGFGASTGTPPVSVDGHADDLAALLDALSPERAVVGGMSMGGYVALAFWRRHRARVRALILVDTRATPDTEEGRAKRRAMAERARTGGASAVADAMMPGITGKSTRARHPEIVAELRAMMERAPVPGVIAALEAMRERPDSTPTLATIDVPTLIVVGEEDALTPVADAKAMHAAIPGSTLAIIPRAGHASNFEQPAEFDQLVMEFLTRV